MIKIAKLNIKNKLYILLDYGRSLIGFLKNPKIINRQS